MNLEYSLILKPFSRIIEVSLPLGPVETPTADLFWIYSIKHLFLSMEQALFPIRKWLVAFTLLVSLFHQWVYLDMTMRHYCSLQGS